jgi:Flp pilus assembly protein TadD
MMRERKLWRWLPFLPILALTEALLILHILNANHVPEVVHQFVFPSRRSGRPVQALYRVEVLAERNGWTPDLLRLAGDLWREAGDITRALPYWQAAAQQGNDVILLRDIAQAAINVQDWASASDTLQHLATLSPDDTWVNLQLGLIEAAVDPSAALDHLTIAARENAYAPLAVQLVDILRGASAEPAFGLSVGSIMADHDLWSYAELAFMQAAGAQPVPEALAYVGFARDMQGKDGGSWIDNAVALSPNNATVRLLQGLHLRHKGDYTASLDALMNAAALDPQNPVMFAELSAGYQLLGDLSNAGYWLQQAVAISGGDPRFQQMLDTLNAEQARLLQTFAVATEEADEATAEPLP